LTVILLSKGGCPVHYLATLRCFFRFFGPPFGGSLLPPKGYFLRSVRKSLENPEKSSASHYQKDD
jgi:hypothetical protein